MKENWHFKIPKTLLLPATDHLALQQGLPTLTSANTHALLSLFQIFSAYANLPLGLNPKRRYALKDKLQSLKNDPNHSFTEIKNLTKKIRVTKERYQQRKALSEELQLSIFSIYESDDVNYIAIQVLPKIFNYLSNAKSDLKRIKLPKEKNHTLNIFSEFIKKTEEKANNHQKEIAQNMLMRLQAADANNDIYYDDVIQHHAKSPKINPTSRNLSRHDFRYYHAYILKRGDTETCSDLQKLSWIKDKTVTLSEIIKPKKPMWPTWFFKGAYILHRAFNNSHHKTFLSLQEKRLNNIDKTQLSSKQLKSIKEIHQIFTREIRRLLKLRKKLYPLFHTTEKEKLTKKIRLLATHQKHATRILKKLQNQMDSDIAEIRKKQEKRKELQQRVDHYNSDVAEQYFVKFIQGSNSSILINGIEYKTDPTTYRKMKSSLNDKNTLQLSLLKRMESSSPNEYNQIHTLTIDLGDSNTQSIWLNQLDQHRLRNFTKIILNPKDSDKLLGEFLQSLMEPSVLFPDTEEVATQLQHLLNHLPTKDWAESQHQACEALGSELLLSNYYARVISFYSSEAIISNPKLVDLIIQRFADEQLTEIEYPELKTPIQNLIKKRLIEKEAENTATLIESEIQNENMTSALSRLHHLERNLQDSRTHPELFDKAKKQLLIVSNALTKSTNNPEALYHQLMEKLKAILSKKAGNPNYLEQFNQLKLSAEQLPYSQKYASLKRLCTAGPHIPYILSELPNAILALAGGQTQTIKLINPLLLDIIESDLISSENKTLLIQLIDASLLDPDNLIPLTEKNRLTALKKCLNGNASPQDKAHFLEPTPTNPFRLTQVETESLDQTTGENKYESTI